MVQTPIEKAANQLGRYSAQAAKLTGRLAKAEPRHIKFSIVLIWLAFLIAVLASNTFIVAGNYGLYAAIQAGAIVGPLREVRDYSACGEFTFPNCETTNYVPSYSIPIKNLFGLAVALSVGLWFWASERERRLSEGKAPSP